MSNKVQPGTAVPDNDDNDENVNQLIDDLMEEGNMTNRLENISYLDNHQTLGPSDNVALPDRTLTHSVIEETSSLKKQNNESTLAAALKQAKLEKQRKENQNNSTLASKGGHTPAQQSKPNLLGFNLLAKKIAGNIVSKVVNISEFEVNFKLKVFLKFLFYQFIFYVLGLMSLPIMLIFENMAMINNMYFWINAGQRVMFFIGVMSWMMLDIMTIGFAFKQLGMFNIQLKGILIEEIYFIYIAVVMRCFIIAVRYGFISNVRMQTMRSKLLDANNVAQDLMIQSWINFDPKILQIEYEAAMYRNHVEDTKFQISFIEDISQEYQERLSDPHYYDKKNTKFNMKEVKKAYTQNLEKIVKKKQNLENIDVFNDYEEAYSLHSFGSSQEHLKKYYSCQLLFREISIFGGAFQINGILPSILLMMMKLSIPFVARAVQGIKLEGTDSIVFSVIEPMFLAMIIMANYLFIFSGMVDFHRRLTMIKACSALIYPVKDTLDHKYQIFPSLNITCKKSLVAWYWLRTCIQDFGRKYLMRIFFYSSTFMAVYTSLGIIGLLSFFELVSFKLSITFYIYLIFDVIVVIGIMMGMIFFGAAFNQQYLNDKFQLTKLKQSLLYIKINIDDVLSEDKFSTPFLKIFQRIYKKRMQDESKDEILESIGDIIDEIDVINERLDLDSEKAPLKIMGLKASYELMNTIYSLVVTIGFAVVQKLFS